MSEHAYLDDLAALGLPTLRALGAFEQVLRHLDPPAIPELRERMGPIHAALNEAISGFGATPPEALQPFHDQFLDGAQRTLGAVAIFLESPPPDQAIMRVLASMRGFCRALEALYPLHEFPPLGRFFVEPPFHERLDELDAEPPEGVSVGVHNASPKEGARGGFTLYVPERYDGTEDWPLVVALHGGSGTGDDFLWTWLREARGRGFLLLAPTSQESTWSMMGPNVDGPALRSMVEFVSERWRVKKSSVLLTGLSDGATYSLLCGLEADSPFTALAPVSGVLHPGALEGDGLARAAGKRIYLVHGARDWMFPIDVARVARDQLTAAGADLTFREIDDLSHTYPREENDRILAWFDPALALPA